MTNETTGQPHGPTWRQRLVARILLLIARMFAETDEQRRELQALADHIQFHRAP